MKIILRGRSDIDRAVNELLSIDLTRPKQISIDSVTRNHEQNAKLHAMLSDISMQAVHAGSKWDLTIWKRLLMYAWLRDTGERAQMIPSLDGSGFDVIYERTSKLTVKQMAEFIEFVYATGTVELDVKFTTKDVWGYE